MADVFDEVEEELRRDKYLELFKKWAPWVGGAALLVILTVAGYQWYDSQQNARSETAGAAYMAALEKRQTGDLDGARADFEALIDGVPGDYDVLSLMQLGAIANEQGDAVQAGRYFQQAAQSASDPLVRDAARYQALLSELDTLSYDDVALRAEPLTRGDSALELMAVELMGVSAIRNQRWDEARSHYERIQFSLDAPQNMSRRATEALALINQNAPVLEEETISGEEDASPAVTPEESPEQALDADAETETQPDPQEEG